MQDWVVWVAVALTGWLVVSGVVGLALGRVFALTQPDPQDEPAYAPRPEPQARRRDGRVRVLVVDDDPSLRLLLRTTLGAERLVVDEAPSAEEAAELARLRPPSVVVLDVALPGESGLAFCRELRDDARFGRPAVILLTGAETSPEAARAAGAGALLRKPFSPLDLIDAIHRQLAGESLPEHAAGLALGEEEQLLLYARDLSRLLEVERAQRRLLQHAYRQTVTALTDALEAKDPATGTHALRVQRYALELTEALDRSLLDDQSLEYGFLLHDVGKIAVPDRILRKPGPLDRQERLLMQRHPLLGVEILRDVALLQGEGIGVVRSHHERWDGSGYPDGLTGEEIPLGARIFALADALDAITSDRPYRGARTWEEAVDDLLAGDGTQFDPRVVTAFVAREPRLRRIHEELAATAA